MRAFGLAIALTLGLFGLAAADAWRVYSAFRALATTELRLTTLSGSIVHLDEALTMSARMAAATGDLAWEKRYHDLEPKLDSHLREVMRLAPEAATHEGATATDAANVELVRLENRAFELVRSDARAQAAELLSSESYEYHKRIYAAGMAGMTHAVHARVAARIQKLEKHAAQSAAIGAVVFVLLSICWWKIVQLVRTHLAARNAAEAALVEARDTLEARVEERTAEIEHGRAALERAYESLKRNQESLVLSEKMASLGRLTAGIAHEMNSPLAAVRASIDVAREVTQEYARSVGDAEVTAEDHRAIARELDEVLDLARAGAERACAFVRSIKAQTRGVRTVERVRFDGVRAIRDALSLLSHAATAAGCSVGVECSIDQAELEGVPGKVEQVVTNLVRNAIDAASETGSGDVRVTVSSDADDFVIEVSDNGPGIPPDVLGHIFDPLFTTKPVGSGTGLGLTIVHDIVRGDFSGRIDVRTAVGVGTTVVVHLPLPKGRSEWLASTEAA